MAGSAASEVEVERLQEVLNMIYTRFTSTKVPLDEKVASEVEMERQQEALSIICLLH